MVICRWMFRPTADRRALSPTVSVVDRALKGDLASELRDQADELPIPLREKIVVAILYMIIVAFVLSTILYFVMLWIGHPEKSTMGRIFWHMLSAFMGYVLGANKIRG